MADANDPKGNKMIAKEGKSGNCGNSPEKSDGKNLKDCKKERIVCDTGTKTPVISALIDNRPQKTSPETPIVSALENTKNNRFARKSTKISNDSGTGQYWQPKPATQKKDFKNSNYYGYPTQATRIFPSQKFKNRGSRRTEEDETGSRCSTPSSTTSTLSNGTNDTDFDDRDLMPHCKIVAEGGEGLPFMQVPSTFSLGLGCFFFFFLRKIFFSSLLSAWLPRVCDL